ncbi:MAG: hypothetical protein WBQ17_00975 [Rhizomicrobium sp.]
MATKSAKRKKPKSKEQYQRFLATAREIGASKSAEDFDKAFKKVVSKK